MNGRHWLHALTARAAGLPARRARQVGPQAAGGHAQRRSALCGGPDGARGWLPPLLAAALGVTAPVLGVTAGADPTPASPPAVPGAVVADPPLSLDSLTAMAATMLHQDGSCDPGDLERMLKTINRQVAAHLVLDRSARCEGLAVAGDAPLSGGGWRLWAFWAVDVPECEGLASALVQVRARELAAVKPVHLCGLHHWEEWLSRMNARREELAAAATAQDQGRCTQLAAAWRDELREFVAEATTFYQGTVPVMGNARIAQALHVDHVPCFRLLSPQNHVHALDGFTPGFPLGEWIGHCQAWEAAQEHRGDAAGTP